MSLVKSKAIQLGFDATPTNNFLIYQPLTPDGTFRIANGNQGATTDIMTVTSGGSVTFAGTTNFSSLNFGAGSESAPSLFPTGDNNTGIWFPAADTFAVSTGGTQRLRIDSSGNVGVGTISPVKPLTINKNDDDAIFIRSADSNASTLQMGTGSLTYIKSGSTGTGTIQPLAFWLGANERMRINSAGKVTIGTTTAGNAGSSMLTVTGNSISFNPNTDGKDTFVFTTGAVDKAKFMMKDVDAVDIQLATDAVSFINTGNNVGIGTTTPLTGLDVRGTSATAASTLQIVGNNVSTLLLGQNANGGVIRGQGGNNRLSFWTGGSADTAAAGSGTEHMHINSSGNVYIGTAGYSALAPLTVRTGSSWNLFANFTNTSGWPTLKFSTDADAPTTGYVSGSNIIFATGTSSAGEKLRITSDGYIGINDANPTSMLRIIANSTISPGDDGGKWIATRFGSSAVYNPAVQGTFNKIVSGIDFGWYSDKWTIGANRGDASEIRSLVFAKNGSEKIVHDGNYTLTIKGQYNHLALGELAGDDNTYMYMLKPDGTAVGKAGFDGYSTSNVYYTDYVIQTRSQADSGLVNRLTISAVNGAVAIPGSLSKGSGSFRIDHPLPQLSETHQLVHSFVEGPQADLIYRGKVVLQNGAATVNIDDAVGMTEGTFVILCRDIQCFTSNETGWTPVRGKVSGNTLTIEAQDPKCTDEISWMVVGERQDPHMYETDWTDENGKVIVEPLKPPKKVHPSEIQSADVVQ